MEYLRNDYYRREYENAAALDVKGTAEGYLEQFGFMVKQSSVELTENYEVRKIILTVAEKEARDTEGIFVEQDLLEYAEREKILIELLSDQTSCHAVYEGGYCPAGLTFEERTRLLHESPEQFRHLVDISLRRHFEVIKIGRASCRERV